MDIREILQAYGNYIFSNNPEHERLAKERFKICYGCDKYNDTALFGPKCDECGCVLKVKTANPESTCPLNKW